MPAGEALMESWKRVLMFFMLMAVAVAVISSYWIYMSYSKEALELRDARIATQEALAKWSGTGNQSGVIKLSEVNESELEPGTTVKIFFANGTLATAVGLGGTVIDFDGSGGVDAFKSLWVKDYEHGLMWEQQLGFIRWAEDENDGRQKYHVNLPVGTHELSVELKFKGQSYEGSGAAFYALDADGNIHMVACDSGITGLGVSCGTERGSNFWFDDNYTVSSSRELTGFYMVTDLENVLGEWWDEARLYRLRVVAE